MRSSALVCSFPAVASGSPQGSQSWVLHSGNCSENFIFLEFVYGSSCTLGAIVSFETFPLVPRRYPSLNSMASTGCLKSFKKYTALSLEIALWMMTNQHKALVGKFMRIKSSIQREVRTALNVTWLRRQRFNLCAMSPWVDSHSRDWICAAGLLPAILLEDCQPTGPWRKWMMARSQPNGPSVTWGGRWGQAHLSISSHPNLWPTGCFEDLRLEKFGPLPTNL